MRAITTLLIATILVAITVADDSQATSVKKPELGKHGEIVQQALNKLSNHLIKNQRFLEMPDFKAVKHDFEAKQACDQESNSQAQVIVLQACPSLAGLIGGTVQPEEFLPTFCGSNCAKVMKEQVLKNIGCIDARTAFLLEWINVCDTRPECFSAGFLQGAKTLGTECKVMDALTQFSNNTAAAKADIAKACQGTCISTMFSFMNNYAKCLSQESDSQVDVGTMKQAFDMFCSKHNDDYCAWNLRSISQIDCDSSCSSSPMCDSRCKFNPTSAQLDTVCTPCFAKFVTLATALGVDETMMKASHNMICGRVVPGDATTKYCLPLAMTFMNAPSSGESTTLPTDAEMKGFCDSETGICIPRILSLAATLSNAKAKATFEYCLAYWGSNYVDWCVERFERDLRKAVASQINADTICSFNSAGKSCLVSSNAMASSSCVTTSLFYRSCQSSSTCPAEFTTLLSNSGCCLPMLNEQIKAQSDAPMPLLPSGVQTIKVRTGKNQWKSVNVTFSRSATTRGDRSLQPANLFAVCGSNETTLWTQVESECATSSDAVERSISLYLSWAAVNSDANRKAQLEASAAADMANAMSIPRSKLKKVKLVEDTTVVVQLRSASRRATATGSGCKLTFTVDDGAKSAAAAAKFDAAVKSNSLNTPTLATTAQTSCPNCVDARASSASSANMPPAKAGSSSSASHIAVAITGLLASLLLMAF